jgi:choloylglycine hydrolase
MLIQRGFMKTGVFLAVMFALMSVNSAFACTDFQLKANDGAVIVGRSMEFELDLQSRLFVHPRGEKRVSDSPSGKGLQWVSKYGFVSANAVGLDTVVDGLNENGLSVGFLWLPESTEYQDVLPGGESRAINILDLGAWILGNFDTVSEVKAAMKNVVVWGKFMPQIQGVPTLHVSVHDAAGNSLVIEFVDGQQKLYDNPNGVLTNEPAFDWQIVNLRNYLNLRALSSGRVNFGGMVLNPTGEGTGLLGIPGDWTPPSRFVRATTMIHFARPADNALQGVNLAQHILNAVDIPKGVVLDDTGSSDYTQWVLIKDLKNKAVYFRSYDNLLLRSLDLKKLDFRPGAKSRSIPISGGLGFVEVNNLLK